MLVVRSPRRRRTYKWHIQDGAVRLELPVGLSTTDEARIIRDVQKNATKRLARTALASDDELLSRGRDLARAHVPLALPRLRSVAWSDRQEHRWGSCTIDAGAIRLTSRLHGLPSYVLEAVLVHELVHLVVADHSRRFHELASAYPRMERARGFLEAIDRGAAPGGGCWSDLD